MGEDRLTVSYRRYAVVHEFITDYAKFLQDCDPADTCSEWVCGFRAAKQLVGEQLEDILRRIDEAPLDGPPTNDRFVVPHGAA